MSTTIGSHRPASRTQERTAPMSREEARRRDEPWRHGTPGKWQDSWANVPQLRGELKRAGTTWCGPAVGTTLARMLGTHTQQDNEALIREFASKYSSPTGTTGQQMMRMISDAGGRVNGPIATGNYADRELEAMLANGNRAVAQIGVRDPKTGTTSAHWVVVMGKDSKGHYTLKDPLQGEVTLSPEQLRAAVTQAPGLGGMLIPVAPNPRGSTQGRFTEDSFVDAAQRDGLKRLNVIPEGVSAKEYAASITKQLTSRDPKVREAGFKRLDALEKDGAPKARDAHEMMLRLFARQPGIGQRNSFSQSDI